MAAVLTSPKEGPAATIDSLDHRFGNRHRSHVVEGKGTEDCSAQCEPTGSVQERGAPSSEILVNRREEWEAIVDRNFMRRKGESKVSLGEGGHGGAKGSSKFTGSVTGDSNWKEGSLMVVDGQPSSLLKELQDVFGGFNSIGGAWDEDESIVGVLDDGARVGRGEGMVNVSSKGMGVEETFEDIGDDNKEVGGQRIPLPEPSAAVDPSTGHTVEKDSRFTGVKECSNPVAPFVAEPTATQD